MRSPEPDPGLQMWPDQYWGEGSPPLAYWRCSFCCSQGYCWPDLQRWLAVLCSACSPQRSQGGSLQSCFPAGQFPECMSARVLLRCCTLRFPLNPLSYFLAHFSSLLRSLWVAVQPVSNIGHLPRFALQAKKLKVPCLHCPDCQWGPTIGCIPGDVLWSCCWS